MLDSFDSSPLLPPAARPRSRPPARCLPHSRRSLLLPIAPEIHSPVASSIAEPSRISARPLRPTGPEGTHTASESQSQGAGPSADHACGQLSLSPILSCPALSHPLHRIAVPPSPCLCPPRNLSRRQLSVPCRSPTRGLKAARTARFDGRQYPHTYAPHGITPHLVACASGRPQWPARHSHTSCTPTLPCPTSTRSPNLSGTSHTPAQRILCPPRRLGTTHTQPLPVSRQQHLAPPIPRPLPPLPPLPVLLRRQAGAPLPVLLPTRRPAAMPPTPASTSAPTV